MIELLQGDCLQILPTLRPALVQCCVTNPPYWGLRDYGTNDQLGLEATPEEYIAKMMAVFREVWRVLRDDGTLWVNMGDVYAHNGVCGGGSPIDDRNPEKYGRIARPSDRLHGRPADRDAQVKTGGTCKSGLKPKDLCGIPWRLAFALQADGWYLRADIIWHKPNPMPESCRDRPTKSHEYIFLLAKQECYFYDTEAIKEPSIYPDDDRKARSTYANKRFPNDLIAGVRPGNGIYADRNKRSVWTIVTQPYPEAHFATFPEELPKLCILAGSKPGDTILDPFAGSGTTGQVALELGRKAILIELNPAYIKLANDRTNVTPGFF